MGLLHYERVRLTNRVEDHCTSGKIRSKIGNRPPPGQGVPFCCGIGAQENLATEQHGTESANGEAELTNPFQGPTSPDFLKTQGLTNAPPPRGGGWSVDQGFKLESPTRFPDGTLGTLCAQGVPDFPGVRTEQGCVHTVSLVYRPALLRATSLVRKSENGTNRKRVASYTIRVYYTHKFLVVLTKIHVHNLLPLEKMSTTMKFETFAIGTGYKPSASTTQPRP